MYVFYPTFTIIPKRVICGAPRALSISTTKIKQGRRRVAEWICGIFNPSSWTGFEIPFHPKLGDTKSSTIHLFPVEITATLRYWCHLAQFQTQSEPAISSAPGNFCDIKERSFRSPQVHYVFFFFSLSHGRMLDQITISQIGDASLSVFYNGRANFRIYRQVLCPFLSLFLPSFRDDCPRYHSGGL